MIHYASSNLLRFPAERPKANRAMRRLAIRPYYRAQVKGLDRLLTPPEVRLTEAEFASREIHDRGPKQPLWRHADV